MKKINATPADLVKVVFNKLKGVKTSSVSPSEKVLNNLFENLFYASLKTEESDFIKVTVTLLNAENPDPRPPDTFVQYRWNVIKFQDVFPFTVDNIVKLSKAADPWSSTLAVDFNSKGDLFIWGLIDQSIHFQNFLHHEAETGPEQPGLFQTSITGIGTLVVILDYDLIATLKQNILIGNYVDVFNYGRVSEIIKSHSQTLKNDIAFFLQNYSKEKNEIWNVEIENRWTQTLSRILILIQNYKHGGSFIITNQNETNLDIKHIIEYNRIYQALKNYIEFSIDYENYTKLIFNEYVGDDDDDAQIPYDLHFDAAVSNENKEQTSNELKGAIRFVSSLSCVDGMVILDNNLQVKGFGAVVKKIKLPAEVYISKSARINLFKLESINTNHFGTRHRAMFSYCWEHEGSLGFVISQDGEIRAITKVDGKLIMWENIKVHHLIKSRKLKSPVIVNRR